MRTNQSFQLNIKLAAQSPSKNKERAEAYKKSGKILRIKSRMQAAKKTGTAHEVAAHILLEITGGRKLKNGIGSTCEITSTGNKKAPTKEATKAIVEEYFLYNELKTFREAAAVLDMSYPYLHLCYRELIKEGRL